MLLLAGSTDKVSLITSAAVAVDVIASYMDMTNADPPVVKSSTSGTQLTAFTTATTADIVNAPSGTDRRNVKHLTVRNKSTTASVDVTVQVNRSAVLYEAHKVTLVPGAVLEFIEGIGFFTISPPALAFYAKVLTADDAGGQNVSTVQPWFPTAGAITLPVGTYKMDGHLYMTRAAGVTAHTTAQQFGGTATYTLQYIAKVNASDVEANSALNRTVSRTAAATVVKASSTSATEAISIDLEGIIRVTVSGTVIPQFIYSVAPGGAPTIKANSNFMFTPLGDQNFATQGTWS